MPESSPEKRRACYISDLLDDELRKHIPKRRGAIKELAVSSANYILDRHDQERFRHYVSIAPDYRSERLVNLSFLMSDELYANIWRSVDGLDTSFTVWMEAAIICYMINQYPDFKIYG